MIPSTHVIRFTLHFTCTATHPCIVSHHLYETWVDCNHYIAVSIHPSFLLGVAKFADGSSEVLGNINLFTLINIYKTVLQFSVL